MEDAACMVADPRARELPRGWSDAGVQTGSNQPETTFGYIADMLNEYKLAYLHIVNSALAAVESKKDPEPHQSRMLDLICSKYRGTLMIAGGFDQDIA